MFHGVEPVRIVLETVHNDVRLVTSPLFRILRSGLSPDEHILVFIPCLYHAFKFVTRSTLIGQKFVVPKGIFQFFIVFIVLF